ncbi:MAG: hypothetical protein H8D05_01005, partial [FCB group bacterium]|nr:hypothetical protein [FCB group bacterium]
MNKSCMLIVVFLVLLLFSCGPELNESVEITDDDAGTEGQLLTVDLPFEVHTYTPEGEAYIVSFNPGQSVLFYYWIPLILQEEFESDIQYLAGLDDSSLAVIPVQLDTASRDQAQRIINEMNISLPVYQTDNTFYNRY